MEIPYLREIAEGYSNGVLPAQKDEQWKNRFAQLYYRIKREMHREQENTFPRPYNKGKAGGMS